MAEKQGCDIQVEALGSRQKLYDVLLWQRRIRGASTASLRYQPELIEVTDHGCCASDGVSKLFMAFTGKEVCQSTSPPVILDIANTPVVKLVCFYYGPNSVQGPKDIILTYARIDQETRDILTLELKASTPEFEEEFFRSPEIVVEEFDRFNVAGLEGLKVRLVWQGDLKTELVIRGDKVQVEVPVNYIKIKNVRSEAFPSAPE